jgi:hypothetical protein
MVQHIEETMLLYLPCRRVVAEAYYDLGRLKNSGMENRVPMVKTLQAAMLRLDPSVRPYLLLLDPDSKNLEVPKPNGNGDDCNDSEMTARLVVVNIRRTINEYRSERWGVVARLKQQFLGGAFSLAVVTYLLIVLAVVRYVPDEAMAGGVVFFSVGAIAGLFAQLVATRESNQPVDDYGYTSTRLAFAPLISGFAAVLGVWALATGVSLTVEPNGSQATQDLPSLEAVYNVSANRGALIVAAAFGIAPAAVINRIQQGVVEAKKDLLASASPGTGRSDG